MKKSILFIWTIGLLFGAQVAFADVTLDNSGRKNIVASHLEGAWDLDVGMSAERLGDRAYAERLSDLRFSFREDENVLQVFNESKNGRKLEAYTVYSVGKTRMTRSGLSYYSGYDYYAVIKKDGNTVLALFSPEGKRGQGDFQFRHTRVTSEGTAREDDTLFLGGDRIEQKMVAFGRAPNR